MCRYQVGDDEANGLLGTVLKMGCRLYLGSLLAYIIE